MLLLYVSQHTAPHNNRRWISWRESPVRWMFFDLFTVQFYTIFSHFLLLLLFPALQTVVDSLLSVLCVYQHIWLPAMKREDDLIISIQERLDYTFLPILEPSSSSLCVVIVKSLPACHAFHHSHAIWYPSAAAAHEASTLIQKLLISSTFNISNPLLSAFYNYIIKFVSLTDAVVA